VRQGRPPPEILTRLAPNQTREIVLPDVLFVDSKIKAIAELMKIRPVTAG
jgi:hypothetical protein